MKSVKGIVSRAIRLVKDGELSFTNQIRVCMIDAS